MPKKYKLIKEYPGSPSIGKEMDESCSVALQFDKYPEFWEVVHEYEILSFKGKLLTDYIYQKEDNDRYRCNISPTYMDIISLGDGLRSNWYDIHSVKRLSDGEIFTVGDKVEGYKNNGIKQITINAFGLRIINDANGDGIVTNQLSWQLRDLVKIKSKQPLFTTEDGVEVFVGDKYWCAHDDKFGSHSMRWTINSNPYEATDDIFYDYRTHEGKINQNKNGNYYFSTQEAAKEYILMNKPCLSIKDVQPLFGGAYLDDSPTTLDKLTSNLKKLVKSKLKQ